MPDLDVPALRAAASAAITSADVLTVATDPDGDRFVLEADGQWTDLMRRTRHSGAVVERFGGQVSHIAVPVATLMALLDAAEERNRLLTALAKQEKEFYARSMNPEGLDEGFRQGMGRVITALRNAADGTGEGSDG